MHEPLGDLEWTDRRHFQRTVFVADRRDRPKMKFAVYEHTPEGGQQNIWNGGSLLSAIAFAKAQCGIDI